MCVLMLFVALWWVSVVGKRSITKLGYLVFPSVYQSFCSACGKQGDAWSVGLLDVFS